MQLDRYQIVSVGDDWAVRLNEKLLKTFSLKAAAIQAAIEATQASGESGNAAEVLTQSEDGEFIPLWIYGRDAYTA